MRQLTSASHRVGFYSELVSRESSRFQALSPIKRGTPYATGLGAEQRIIDLFGQGLVFVKEETPLGGVDVRGMVNDEWIIWQWSSDQNADDATNAEATFPYDSLTFPAYGRVTTVRREVYESSPTVAYGSALTGLIAIKVTAGGTGYVDGDAVTISGSHGCAAEIVVDANGTIVAVIITNEGNGLDSASLPTIGVTSTTGSGATLVAIVQPKTAILTSQKKSELPDSDPLSHEFVQLTRIYETLPGAVIPFTRWDNALGPIQGTRRAIIWANQVATVSATGKTTYQARQDSSYVAWELIETNSDGTGSDGNPTFPLYTEQIHNQQNEPGTRATQTVVATGQTGNTAVVGGNIVTTDYLTIAGNPFLLSKVVETFPIFPGNTYEDASPAYPSEYVTDEATTAVTSAGNASAPTAPTGGRASEQQVDKLEKRVTTTTPTLSKTVVEKDTNAAKQLVTRTKVADGSVGSPSATATVKLNRTAGGRAEAVTESVDTLFDAHSYTVEKPDPVPEEFRAGIPTETETTRSAATSVSLPSLTSHQLRVTTAREDSFTIRTDTTSRDNGTLPVLAGQEYNRELDVAIPFTEEVAAASSGAKTDSQPLSDSLSRNKTYDPSAISGIANVWYGVVEHSFPDELLSAVVAAGGTGQINVEVKVTDGYSGPCDARFTETFVAGPPGSAAGITPFFPQSFYGHMSLKDFSISGIAVQLPPGGLLIETIPVRIPKCLHGGIDLSFDVYGITGGDGTSGTPYTFGSLGTVSFGTIEATSPTSLPHGAYILKGVDVTRAGYGLWRVVVVEVKVP